MSKSVRALYFCDWLPPDFGAVGQYEIATARRHAREGRAITLVGFSSTADSEESSPVGSGSLSVRRIYRPVYDRSSWLRRASWTLRANIALVWNARREIVTADEIRFTGSPPYLIHFIMPIAWMLRKRTRYRIADFHPECLIAALGWNPWWLRLVHALTGFWRRRVTVFEVLGEDQRRRLLAQGIRPDCIELKRDSSPVEITGKELGRFRPAEMTNRYLILYSGNWGRAHESETFVDAVARLPMEVRLRLGIWLNCVGKEGQAVYERLSREPGLAVKYTRPYPLRDLPEVLASADCHLITLRDAFVGYVLPSKVYGCIDSRKPILYIGSRDSDVHSLCIQAAAGRYHQADCGKAKTVSEILIRLVGAWPARGDEHAA